MHLRTENHKELLRKLAVMSLCTAALLSCQQGDEPSQTLRCNYPRDWVNDPPPSNKVIVTIKKSSSRLSLNGEMVGQHEFMKRMKSWSELSPSPLFLVEVSENDTCAYRIEILNLIDSIVDCKNSACGVTLDARRQIIR